MNYPKEFFLGNIYPIEKTRQQTKPDCWSQAITSASGDSFSIENNLQPIYLSPIYLGSLMNDICNFSKKNINTKYNCPRKYTNGLIFEYPNAYLKYEKKGLKLDRCFPYDSTYFYLLQNSYDKYKKMSNLNNIKYPEISEDEWFKGKYYEPENINNLCSNGCINKKEKCIIPNNVKKHIFEVQIKDYKPIGLNFKKLNDYTNEDIKKIQNFIKNELFNQRRPIATTIMYTQELINFFKNYEKTKNNYFIPKIKIKNQKYFSHVVVILGWENKDRKEYWIVRDTNFPNIFLKIEFSNFNNKEYWLDIDVHSDESGTINISYDTVGYYGNSNLHEYLSQGFFKKLEINKIEINDEL